MNILVIGGLGNMGRRYVSILRYLNHTPVITDIDTKKEDVVELAKKSDGIIIATPTIKHMSYLKLLLPLDKNILCEKPITKNPRDFHEINELLKKGSVLQMVSQYEELLKCPQIKDMDHFNEEGKKIIVKYKTRYNYFKHGSDGLFWDCIQIFKYAAGDIYLGETSPIWECKINNELLSLGKMDHAYINHIKKWILGGFRDNSTDVDYMDDMYLLHKKIKELQGQYDLNEQKCFNWHTSKVCIE